MGTRKCSFNTARKELSSETIATLQIMHQSDRYSCAHSKHLIILSKKVNFTNLKHLITGISGCKKSSSEASIMRLKYQR